MYFNKEELNIIYDILERRLNYLETEKSPSSYDERNNISILLDKIEKYLK